MKAFKIIAWDIRTINTISVGICLYAWKLQLFQLHISLMIIKWIHRVFRLCKRKEMSPMHYEVDSNGKQVYFKRLYCKGCDTSIFIEVKDSKPNPPLD
jgi:hypothetical protein